MKLFLSGYLRYTRTQRRALLLLFVLILLLQAAFWIDIPRTKIHPPDNAAWLALQREIDSLKIDARPKPFRWTPFNPNFISDYKAYRLGLSAAQADRLFAFRKTGRYVNSPQDFQRVTGISDSLLRTISPWFKFPDWVTRKTAYRSYKSESPKKPRIKVDLNQASKQQLMAVYGIGDALSDRILQEKVKFGQFVSMEQMAHVWGLRPEVVEKLNDAFEIKAVPQTKKWNVNEASVRELAQFPYFRYALAKAIVTYRSMNGKITSVADLSKISGFPVDCEKIIALYLEF